MATGEVPTDASRSTMHHPEPGDLLRADDGHPPSAAESQNDETSVKLELNDHTDISAGAKGQASLKTRKRTKTGCLTCRKRRIKCGEERPTCANCVKSKRSCEGYAPRVVFKDPLGAFRPTGWAVKGAGAHYSAPSSHLGAVSQYGRSQAGSAAQNQLPAIAPRPSPQMSQHGPYHLPSPVTPIWSGEHYRPSSSSFVPHSDGLAELPPRMHPLYNPHDSFQDRNQIVLEKEPPATKSLPSAFHPAIHNYLDGPDNSTVATNHANVPPEWSQSSVPSSGAMEGYPQRSSPFDPANPLSGHAVVNTPTVFTSPSSYSGGLDQAAAPVWSIPPQSNVPVDRSRSLEEAQPANSYISPTHTIPDLRGQNWPTSNESPDDIYEDSGKSYDIAGLTEFDLHEFPVDSKLLNTFLQPAPLQAVVPIEEPEDDYFDVDSDEEGASRYHIASAPQSDLGLMLALAASQDDRTLRSYTTFLNEPNVLSAYLPNFNASPLMDSKTARIFCHFITATGPSLSIYERHPTNPSVMFTGAPVPSSQQALWTYTLPMMALTHQGLLHAMLALASLHIAKLQQTSAHPSLKHYHYALRRIAKAVSTPSRRQDVATIAATLILGFYEATTAEHSKWNSHLAGASQLLMEVDFKGITKRIKEERAKAEASRKIGSWYYPFGTFGNGQLQPYIGRDPSSHLFMPKEDGVDENLVSNLTGWKVRYDEYGQIVDDSTPSEFKKPLTSKDIESYNLHRDLFWWYCKQDVYQSIVSGNRLLMPYDRWGHCPPRAPMGKIDAVYGSMDHLVLLMGRIADFASKDQLRKRKAVAANGGQWIPPPGMFPGPPPNVSPMGIQQHGQMPQPPSISNSQSSRKRSPEMYGMMPGVVPPKMPEAFSQRPQDKTYIERSAVENTEFATATKEAEAEWHELNHALDIFEESLGNDYLPLSSEYMQPLETPFGSAIYYRTYSMSCVWVLYYTGRIINARSHPSMPPAAMMAAGIAAAKTAHWANIIGRICAGLQPMSTSASLNPSLGAALMESTLGLFFAGVQYRDAEQRRYTIDALRTISQLTGWQSSSLIAAGCEVCWTKMAEAGRGPPYEKTMETVPKDDRLSGKKLPTGQEPLKDSNDRRYVFVNPGTRVHWAMGIMSMEEDFQGLSIGS